MLSKQVLTAILSFAALFSMAHARAQTPGPEADWSEIQPVLDQRCVLCHKGEFAPLGLRLDSLDGLLAGSDNGPVVVAGNPAGSELIRRIRGESLPRMPMTGPPYLSAEEIARFEAWVAGGLQAGATIETPSRTDDAATESTVAPQPVDDGPVTWQQVAPIFATRCAKCHTDGGLMGAPPEGYRLTSYESALSPADRVRVVPGRPDASELVRRIRGDSLPRMPFDGPPYLDAEEIEMIVEWIAGGAPNAAGQVAETPTGAEVRLHGVLTGRWVLDGLELIVPSGARVRDNPRTGDYVEVRGVIDARGRVRVERLRVR